MGFVSNIKVGKIQECYIREKLLDEAKESLKTN